jgi:hypothetical protein
VALRPRDPEARCRLGLVLLDESRAEEGLRRWIAPSSWGSTTRRSDSAGVRRQESLTAG